MILKFRMHSCLQNKIEYKKGYIEKTKNKLKHMKTKIDWGGSKLN